MREAEWPRKGKKEEAATAAANIDKGLRRMKFFPCFFSRETNFKLTI